MIVEVLPDIWLGDTNISPRFIKEKNIKYVINCQEDLSFFGKSQEYVDLVKLSLMKKEIEGLLKYLHQITKHVYQTVRQGSPILIVCQTGLKKAPLLIVGYLIKYGHMNLNNAINALNSKTPKKVNFNQLDRMGLQYFQKEIVDEIQRQKQGTQT